MDPVKVNKLAIEDFKNDCENAFGLLYITYYPKCKDYILKNKGKSEDAEDIFQDALLILFEKLHADNFEVYTCLSNYLMGITKNLWLRKLTNRVFYVEYPDQYYQENQHAIDLAIDKEIDYLEKLSDYMKKISDHCQDLLTDIFFKNKNIIEIQQKYNYSNKHNAQNQKYKCIEQIKNVKQKQIFLA
ncbi:sigma-70 family RNA polymerase sigma factor [Chryseobacterium sp. Tr-659]|uniref:RNA polymerase sigma factor n=1 Tax=Chryseobacterium sp. Tr-659 TaxID=2608340 RepID=UPI00142401D1|nr:sigma-70 family RNA polymerase sigma factor [Chryseobacterium sp. Tr-659]NIF06674.1 sigma-70 family RNA polymerase sigma factor [Chryseobacterium sp. Tr-659]